jgi:SRSO17 transposase
MTGVPVEQMLELWCVALRQVKAQLKSLFAHPSVAASAAAFLDGLLGPEPRKTGWMRAEAAGDPGPWRQQAVLGRSHWEADALRDMVREYALETLASPEAVLVIDETGFLKQGQRSCGVGRQYTGSAGKIASCQIGVFAAYVSDKGCALIDRQLYLPKDWTTKPERLAAAHVPDAIRFVTKPQIGHQATDRSRDDRAGACGWRPIRLGGDRHDLWRGQSGDAAAPGRQRLRAGRPCHRSLQFLG